MWNKIQQIRELIKNAKKFKKRVCWRCGKQLNIYDFLSDNIEYSAIQIFKLWQSPLLEFHCCDCFKVLKSDELETIERIQNTRECAYCGTIIELYQYSKQNNYLKIHELKNIWLNSKINVFCDNICRKKYNRTLGDSFIRFK